MQLTITTAKPFSFAQSLRFIKRFPPCAQEVIATDDSVTAAVALDGRAHAFTLRDAGGDLLVEAASEVVARRAAEFVSASDDVNELYAIAAEDPPFQAVVDMLYGLHHVRFLGLEEIAVYCVMMQRTPLKLATAYKRKFLDRFGLRVEVGDRTLRAMPDLAHLAELDADAIADAIGHPGKADRIAAIARGVHAIGERFLRTAPYADAREALLAIPGCGPFSAGAILLRGLGRMEQLPGLAMFEREGKRLYGRAWDEAAIARRYGDQIGYWSFYLKTGTAIAFANANAGMTN